MFDVVRRHPLAAILAVANVLVLGFLVARQTGAPQSSAVTAPATPAVKFCDPTSAAPCPAAPACPACPAAPAGNNGKCRPKLRLVLGGGDTFLSEQHKYMEIAARKAGIETVHSARQAMESDPGLDSCVYIVRDMNWGQFADPDRHVPDAQLRPGGSVWKLYDVPDQFVRNWMPENRTRNTISLQPGYPAVISFLKDDPYDASAHVALQEVFSHRQHVWAPLGVSQRVGEGVAFPGHGPNKKRIMLDEVWYGIDWANGQRPFDTYQKTVLLKMIEITRVLHDKYGYEINTYVGRAQHHKGQVWNQFPWINVVSIGGRDNHLNFIRSHTMVMWHFPETYGMGYYDVMQMGIPSFVFAESVQPFVFEHMFNSVVSSYNLSPEVSADMIVHYLEHVYTEPLFKRIRDWSSATLSAETWGFRLQKILRARGILC